MNIFLPRAKIKAGVLLQTRYFKQRKNIFFSKSSTLVLGPT